MNLIEEIKQSNSIALSSGAKKGNIETCQKNYVHSVLRQCRYPM